MLSLWADRNSSSLPCLFHSCFSCRWQRAQELSRSLIPTAPKKTGRADAYWIRITHLTPQPPSGGKYEEFTNKLWEFSVLFPEKKRGIWTFNFFALTVIKSEIFFFFGEKVSGVCKFYYNVDERSVEKKGIKVVSRQTVMALSYNLDRWKLPYFTG